MRNKNLIGTGVAIVTPFDKKGNVDTDSLAGIVKHLHAGKVEYIVVLGTTGESVTLTKEEKEIVINTVVKANGNKVPLVLGIGSNNTAEVVHTIKKTNLKDFEVLPRSLSRARNRTVALPRHDTRD
ncbi:MAG: dihydrodipicolinate synthase family protein, partial [Bacteroidia bacterium]